MDFKGILEGQITNLTAQRDNARDVYNQTLGALELAKFLLQQTGEKDHMTEQEFVELVGGPGSRVESITPSG